EPAKASKPAKAPKPPKKPKPAKTQPAKDPEPIPRFVEFRPGNTLNYLFGALFLVFVVGAVIAIFVAVSNGGSPAVFAAAGMVLAAMASWWALLNWTPAIVSISNGTLEISRGASSTTWDLRDPATDLTMSGSPTSRSWKTVLKAKDGKQHTISSSTVEPEQFAQIVEHYRSGKDAEISAD
ncbi:hypothetical protein EFK50_18660, partial [Nocardioides marmoriginsengisoli]